MFTTELSHIHNGANSFKIHPSSVHLMKSCWFKESLFTIMKIWKIKKHCMSIKQAELIANAHKQNWLNSFCNSPVHNGYLCMIHSGAPQRQNEVQLCSLKVAMCSWLWRSIVSVMFTVWPCMSPVFTREPWHVHYGVLLCSGTGVFTTQSWRAHCRVPLSLLWSLVFTAEAGVFTGIEL